MKNYLLAIICIVVLSGYKNTVRCGEPFAAARPSGSLQFKKASLNDPKANCDAFSMLIPLDWSLTGNITWLTDNFAFPAEGHFQVESADKEKELEGFPLGCYYVTKNQMMFNMYYNRSHYLGCTVVKEMPSAVNAISNYVIAKYRANVQNLKVVETKILSPEENMPAPPGMSGHGATALVRLEYELNGKAYEENFYGRRSAIEDPQNLAIMWFISDCYAFRTPKGKVADNLDLFQTMVHSFEINKVWYDVFLKISEYMTKAEKASIDATMEQFRIRVAADAHISAIHRQMYEDNQKAQERINEKFDDNIRGVEPYSDPSTGEKVKLPIGHDHVFYNGASGTYLLSDDANATKNLKGNWTEWNRSH